MKKIPYLDILTSLLPKNEWENFLQSYNQPIPKNITIINHKIDDDRDVAMQRLCRDAINRVSSSSNRPWQHFLHQGWFFYIQEQAASLPAQVLLNDERKSKVQGLSSTDLILDMCAAPGGKTIQLADSLLSPLIRGEGAKRKGGLWSSTGFVIANELIDPRRKALIYNINRCGCINTAITNYDGTKIGNLTPDTFDKVLIDAPCSGEGMNYKIAIQQSRDELKIKKIASLQYQLLKSGIQACKPWWTIVYSTCTLNPIENEWVIANIMQEFSWKIELENVDVQNKSTGIDIWNGERIIDQNSASKLARFRPHIHHIGWFFIARFVKTQNIASHDRDAINRVSTGDEKLQKLIADKLHADFGITIDPQYYAFLQTQNAIYVTTPVYHDIPASLHIQKIWIPIYDLGRDKDNRIPTHHLGNILGHLATKNVIELADEEAQEYSDHKDITIPVETLHATSLSGGKFTILTWKKHWFSIGKVVDWRIKNKMI